MEGRRGCHPSPQSDSEAPAKEQDRVLPIANVGRIMKKSLPANAKISKEAKETIQECVSEFIGFVTGEASDKCRREKRKTINGDDLLWAMTTLGFDDYAVHLDGYLNQFREVEGEKTGRVAMQGDDQSPMEDMAHQNSSKQYILSNLMINSNPETTTAVNLDMSSISPEFYSLIDAPISHDPVDGGNGRGYGQYLSGFTGRLGENYGIGGASNGESTAFLAAHNYHYMAPYPSYL